jgi:hypothetical protein
MKGFTVKELGAALKAFQISIHPDKFATNAPVSKCNGETFKIVTSMTIGLCEALDRRTGNDLHFPLSPTNICFYLPDLSLQTHTLSFSPEDTFGKDQLYISWQESALSLLHLFSKAKVSFDSRLTQSLLYSCMNSSVSDSDQGLFGAILSENNLAFSIEKMQVLIPKLTNVHISSELSLISKKVALESIWRSRDVLLKLQQSRPSVRIVVTDDSTANHSFTTVLVPPHFSSLELANKSKFSFSLPIS